MRGTFAVVLTISVLVLSSNLVAARAVTLEGCVNSREDCCPTGRTRPIEWEWDDFLDCDIGPVAIDELLPE